MEGKRIVLNIPSGYERVERIKMVDIYTACDILKSRRQKRITAARRLGDTAELISHYIKCPHCGYEEPSYFHYLNSGFSANPKRSAEEIAEWAYIQLSALGEPEERMEIQQLESVCGEYICKNCGYGSVSSNGLGQIIINCTDKMVSVQRTIRNLSELVSLKWLKGTEEMGFPIYEQVEFDFESRISRIDLICEAGVICSVNLNDYDQGFEGDKLVELFSKNRKLKRTVRGCLEKIAGCKMPFTTDELDIDKFVGFVRFTGFSKDFYKAIPFWRGTGVVDESFKAVTDNLYDAYGAMELLEKSAIPFCKSVKRLFVQKSGLFFYLKECEFIYGLFNDVNLFCAFLKEDLIFHFLSMLHYYENSVKVFLEDYSSVLGKERFANRFHPGDDIIRYGVFYGALSDYVRKKEQEKWLCGIDVFDDFNIISYGINNISVPFFCVTNDMRDTVVDKYRFRYLRTKRECVLAGEKMKNCLVNWDSFSDPVALIYKGDEIVAAVEVYKNVLKQVRKCGNKSIKTDSILCKAVEKWCVKNGVEFDSQNLDGDFI